MYAECVERLIEEFKKLPGIGSRTSERLALYVSRQGRERALQLADAVRDVAERIRCCSVCYNSSESDPCPICASGGRRRDQILVVEGPNDLIRFEDAGWRGLYHVLQGALDPIEGILPEHLTLDALVKRIEDGGISEVIVATNPDYEGDGTALLLAKRLQGGAVKITRLARGIASGAKIEYASKAMLADALLGRVPIQDKNGTP